VYRLNPFAVAGGHASAFQRQNYWLTTKMGAVKTFEYLCYKGGYKVDLFFMYIICTFKDRSV
jgi:hypothetical protein